VLSAVRVAVTAEAPVTSTVPGGMAQVTGLVAPEGPVTAHVRSTTPVNPFDGVTLIVDVLPVVAPWRTVMFPLLLNANEGVTVAVTVTLTVVVWVIEADLPVTVIT
jgi:hypothetical protein